MLERMSLRLALREHVIPGEVRASSGKVVTNYVDCRPVVLTSEYIKLVAKLLLEEIEYLGAPFDAVGGPELSGVPLVVALCCLAPLKGFIVRKEVKDHGTRRQIEGNVGQGSRVVLVDDVVTTGTSLLRAIRVCREAGLDVVGAVALVDRGEGGGESIARECPFSSVFTLSELL